MRRPSLLLTPCLAALLAAFAALAIGACGGYGRPNQASSQLAFGVSMAQRGLWQEALFRFNEAERIDPQNPHVHNNLGVAYEAAGDFDKALDHYRRALQLAPNSREVKANYARFVEFYQGYKSKDGKGAQTAKPAAKGARGKPSSPKEPDQPVGVGQPPPQPIPNPGPLTPEPNTAPPPPGGSR